MYVVSHLHDNLAKDVLSLRDLTTGKHITDIDLPDIGSVEDLTCKSHHREFFYSFTSFLYPKTIYHVTLDDTAGSLEVKQKLLRRTVVPGIDPTLFFTQQVVYVF